MRHLSRFLTPSLLTAGAALAAYGGYGAGVGHAAGGGLPHWLQVAAAAATGSGAFAFGLWRSRRSSGDRSGSFADDLAPLERLAPTLQGHPDGLAALKRLVEVLFEACHRPEPSRTAETLVEAEGRRDA